MNRIKHRILNWLIKKTYKLVGDNEVIKVSTGGRLFLGDSELPEGVVQNIVHDAKYFQKSEVWKLISNQVRYIANVNTITKSTSADDLLVGKTTIHTIGMIENTIKKLAELEVKKSEVKEEPKVEKVEPKKK
jgi:hypothetical protein